jgi:hypothetical protein
MNSIVTPNKTSKRMRNAICFAICAVLQTNHTEKQTVITVERFAPLIKTLDKLV